MSIFGIFVSKARAIESSMERAFHLVYLRVFHERLSVCVLASFPYVFEGGVWNLIIFIPIIAFLFILTHLISKP